jgi:transposase
MERPAPDSQLADYAVNREDPRRRAAYEWEPAMSNVRFVGLDVHAESIAVAVAEANGEVRSLGVIPNRAESVGRLMRKLGKPEQLRVCYEAGPTGYVLYWQLSELGVKCEVVAPTLIPVKAGDRVKTDRRDAAKLARSYRAGDLTAVWVPDAAHEALRDLVRARWAAKRDQLRARHRLSKFLLRQGRRAPEGTTPWTQRYLLWVKRQVRFTYPAQEVTLGDYLHEVEHAAERILRLERSIDAAIATLPVKMRAVIEALQSLRGIAQLSAVSIMAELGELSRFEHPRQLMGYSGAVSCEHSSGERIHRGAISKTGNAHLRRIVVEAAWAYRHRPAIGHSLALRQRRSSAAVTGLAWKAQQRLHQRYARLMARGKCKQQTITAVGRELLGFIWAIGVHVERELNVPVRQAA